MRDRVAMRMTVKVLRLTVDLQQVWDLLKLLLCLSCLIHKMNMIITPLSKGYFVRSKWKKIMGSNKRITLWLLRLQ